MTRELLLLRHGKAEKLKQGSDFNRPISDPGKRAAQRMATWIWRNDLMPDYVISSPAARALETARKACKAMGMFNFHTTENQWAAFGKLVDVVSYSGAVHFIKIIELRLKILEGQCVADGW